MVFMAVNVYEADLRYFYAERYTTDANGAKAVKAAAAAYMAKSFAIIEPALQPFLLGSAMSIADVYLAMLTTWSPAPLTGPRFASLRQAVAADPDYGPVWTRHGLVA